MSQEQAVQEAQATAQAQATSQATDQATVTSQDDKVVQVSDGAGAGTIAYSAYGRGGMSVHTGADYVENRDWSIKLVDDDKKADAEKIPLGATIKGKKPTQRTTGRGDSKKLVFLEDGVTPSIVNKLTPTPIKLLTLVETLQDVMQKNGAEILVGNLVAPIYNAAFKANNAIPSGYMLTDYDIMQYYGLTSVKDCILLVMTKSYKPRQGSQSASADYAASCSLPEDETQSDIFTTYAALFKDADPKRFKKLGSKAQLNQLSSFLARGCTPRGKTYPSVTVLDLGRQIFEVHLSNAKLNLTMVDQAIADGNEAVVAERAMIIAKMGEYTFIACALNTAYDAARKIDEAKVLAAKAASVEAADTDGDGQTDVFIDML